MENIDNPISPNTSFQPTQSLLPNQNPQTNLYKTLFLIFFCLFLIIISVLTTFFITNNKSAPKITEINTSTTIPCQTFDTTTNWKTYTDKLSGLSFKYPSTITINNFNLDPQFLSPYLKVSVAEMDNLEGDGLLPAWYLDKENSLAIKKSLESGKLNTDQTTSPTTVMGGNNYKLVNLSKSINGEVYDVSGRFDICDVTLERNLIFYIKNYQILITYGLGDGEAIQHLIPTKYLKNPPKECIQYKVWADTENFYKDLSENKGENQITQDWYNNFDKIISSIKFN